MKVDTHGRTLISDGSTVDEILARAILNHPDAIAIADHADAKLRAATFDRRWTRRAKATMDLAHGNLAEGANANGLQ